MIARKDNRTDALHHVLELLGKILVVLSDSPDDCHESTLEVEAGLTRD